MARPTGARGYYSLTAAGRKHLEGERTEFEHMVRAIQDVLQAA